MDNIIEWQGVRAKDFFFENDCTPIDNKSDYVFSLIIAVCNSEKYIAETLDSIIAQDFDFSKIQVILVDDGSTDKSYEICKKYVLDYPNNLILVHKENGGVSSARNVGVHFAIGKYINFIDSDDLFGKNVCSTVYKFFESNQNKTDVVAIRVKIFGDKTGESWYNKKFDKGNRIINLFSEPAVYLNSTNNSFFHKRIKNQLHFDESLSIAEDLKVVNTVLMNRYTLGVINDCLYYYRIRSRGSLVSTAKSKETWYLVYLEKVYFWLYEKSVKQTGRFLEFLQYTLLRELYNRLNNNHECVYVLKDKTLIDIYKSTLFRALFLIDDNIIRKCGFLNTDFMLYIFGKKYGRPTIVFNNDQVHFKWKNNIDIGKKLYACYDMCEVHNGVLVLEGYVIVNNVQLRNDEYKIKLSIDEKVREIVPIEKTDNDFLAFADEYVFYRKYFKISLNYPNKAANLKLVLNIDGEDIPYQVYGYDQWFGVDKNLPESYYYDKHFLLKIKNGMLCVQRASRLTAFLQEVKLLKSLHAKSKKDPLCKKSFKLRLYHGIGKLFRMRKIWIVSDRCIGAGDNGEAFYGYVRHKKSVNAYFAINSDSPDYRRLSESGFKLLPIGSKKYKKKFLLADKIISAHFDHGELHPISTPYLNDIIAKKKHVFLQHGITKDDVSHFYSRKKQKIDCFITAARPEYLSIVNNANYFCDDDIVKLTGFPRYDKLRSATEKIILIMPTWRNNLVYFGVDSKGGKVSDDFLNSYYYKFYHDLLSNKQLHEKAKESGYKIYYFPHFNMTATNDYFDEVKDVKIIAGNERNYNNMFSIADIMVTDYSSTAFDFAYLRKPIIYCQGDREEFFATHTYTKDYFDYDKDGFGRVTSTVSETIEELTRLIDKDCKIDEEYLKRIDDFFAFNDNKNCERVYKAINGEKK